MAHELGREATDFIQSELSYGRSLSKHLSAVSLESGRVVAILPTTVEPAALTDFQSGDVATGEEVHKLADLILKYISEAASRICVLEHPTLRKGDPRFPPVDYFTVGSEVFLFLSNRPNHEMVVKSAREAHWYPSIGVLTTLGNEQSLPQPASAQTEDFLDELAKHVDAVVVGAYDAESWLVWFSERYEEQAAHMATVFGEGG